MNENTVRYNIVRKKLLKPKLIKIRKEFQIEALHIKGKSPAIVFIHGGLGNLWNHYPQMNHFFKKRQILAYNIAGYGKSSYSSPHNLFDHVQDLAELLLIFKIKEPILHAFSYGTTIALEYAKRYPVKAIIIVGGAAIKMTPYWEKVILKQLFLSGFNKLKSIRRTLEKKSYNILFSMKTPFEIKDDFIKSNPMPSRKESWLALSEAFWNYDGRDNLDSIKAPVLIVRGEEEKFLSKETAEETAKLLPNGIFREIKNAGHLLHIEKQEEYNKLLEQFLNKIS